MYSVLNISAIGMQAQQKNLETISNNLANANTPGFKKSRVQFSELVGRNAQITQNFENQAVSSMDSKTASGAQLTMQRLFEEGEFKKTGVPMDLAIQGEGFVEVLMPDMSSAYFKGGSLSVNKEGLLSVGNGLPLKPGIHIPASSEAIQISADGKVYVQSGGDKTWQEIAQLELSYFDNPSRLDSINDGLYKATDASGQALRSDFGQQRGGVFMQGYLEMSNVKMLDEIMNLMMAQRTYEANVKLVQAADEMLGLVNTMRK